MPWPSPRKFLRKNWKGEEVPKLHPGLADKEYWDLRLKLFELQQQGLFTDSDAYEEIKRDLLEDLHNYLIIQVGEQDPWS